MPYIIGVDPGVSTVRYCVDVPDSFAFRAAFRGALFELTEAYNWEYIDTLSELTPDQYAALAQTMFDGLAPCGGGGGDMELIADVELASDVGYVEFTDIPQTFAGLQMHSELQSNSTDPFDTLVMTLNSDTGANYSQGSSRIQHSSSSHLANAVLNNTYIAWPRLVATTAAGTLVMSSQKIDLPNYATPDRYKIVRITGINLVDDNQTSDYHTLIGMGRWNNSAAGISTIRLSPADGTVFKALSRVRLYGLNGV